MNKPIVIISDTCIPDKTVTLGYSGGMALYAANWHSVMYFFRVTDPVNVAYAATANNNILN